MEIREIMTPDPRTVGPGDSLQNAARIMRDEDAGVVPVVDGGKVIGIVTDRDIVIRAVAEGKNDLKVRDVLSKDVVCASPDMSTSDATDLMGEHQIRRLPVVDDSHKLVGIVSIGDIAVKDGRDRRTGDTLESISEGVKRH